MMGHDKHSPDRPFPDLLAAYADGELDAAGRARVEAWLAAHPAARADLAAQRRLSRRNRKFWRFAAAPPPSEGSWAKVFGRVQDALDAPVRPAPPVPSAPPRRRLARYAAAMLATAAAALVALRLGGPRPDGAVAVAPEPPPAHDALVLATDADVDIISIDDRDAGQIVVGRPPLAHTDVVVLAGIGEVDLKGIQKDADGMVPKAPMNDAGNAPMIIAPVAGR